MKGFNANRLPDPPLRPGGIIDFSSALSNPKFAAEQAVRSANSGVRTLVFGKIALQGTDLKVPAQIGADALCGRHGT